MTRSSGAVPVRIPGPRAAGRRRRYGPPGRLPRPAAGDEDGGAAWNSAGDRPRHARWGGPARTGRSRPPAPAIPAGEVVASPPDGLAVIDADARFVDANPAAVQLC